MKNFDSECDDEIKILEKNDNISYEDIYRALWEPLQDNKQDCATFVSGLRNSIGEAGVCFIALHDNEIVGTLSAKLTKREKWFANGPVVYYMYARVDPEWQGKHINSMLTKKVFEYAESNHCPIVVLNTRPNNKHAITVYSHYGFKIVRFFHRKNKGFELAMVKYFDRDYCGLKVAVVDLGIRVLLPFYRFARGCRDILKRFF